ncbi:MAG: hypothetical protein HQ542_02660 [Bacteroidia bacterium]|nr:hypothetical protein [Bacteroidia bacterium]
MELLTSSDWTDYELIDTGNREKLEQFGKYILIRPEPQAVWPKAMPEEEWDKLSHARFSRGKSGSSQVAVGSPQSAGGSEQVAVGNKQSPRHHGTSHQSPVTGHESRGEWIKKQEMPDQWMIGYKYKEMHLKFRLGLTAFGHIGVFPEQAENWKFIYDAIQLAVGSWQLAKRMSKEEQAQGTEHRAQGSGPGAQEEEALSLRGAEAAREPKQERRGNSIQHPGSVF